MNALFGLAAAPKAANVAMNATNNALGAFTRPFGQFFQSAVEEGDSSASAASAAAAHEAASLEQRISRQLQELLTSLGAEADEEAAIRFDESHWRDQRRRASQRAGDRSGPQERFATDVRPAAVGEAAERIRSVGVADRLGTASARHRKRRSPAPLAVGWDNVPPTSRFIALPVGRCPAYGASASPIARRLGDRCGCSAECRRRDRRCRPVPSPRARPTRCSIASTRARCPDMVLRHRIAPPHDVRFYWFAIRPNQFGHLLLGRRDQFRIVAIDPVGLQHAAGENANDRASRRTMARELDREKTRRNDRPSLDRGDDDAEAVERVIDVLPVIDERHDRAAGVLDARQLARQFGVDTAEQRRRLRGVRGDQHAVEMFERRAREPF